MMMFRSVVRRVRTGQPVVLIFKNTNIGELPNFGLVLSAFLWTPDAVEYSWHFFMYDLDKLADEGGVHQVTGGFCVFRIMFLMLLYTLLRFASLWYGAYHLLDYCF